MCARNVYAMCNNFDWLLLTCNWLEHCERSGKRSRAVTVSGSQKKTGWASGAWSGGPRGAGLRERSGGYKSLRFDADRQNIPLRSHALIVMLRMFTARPATKKKLTRIKPTHLKFVFGLKKIIKILFLDIFAYQWTSFVFVGWTGHRWRPFPWKFTA